jgi:HEPN domain-containing protein
MSERSQDWFRQPVRDLESAHAQKEDGFFEWACFIAQQAAEKAVKAVYQKLGGEAWGHAVTDLLRGLEEKVSVPGEILACAQDLDKFYIPARYPNGWATGAPTEYIKREDAEHALIDSKQIIEFCKGFLA